MRATGQGGLIFAFFVLPGMSAVPLVACSGGDSSRRVEPGSDGSPEGTLLASGAAKGSGGGPGGAGGTRGSGGRAVSPRDAAPPDVSAPADDASKPGKDASVPDSRDARCGDGALSFSGAQFVQIPGTEGLDLKSGMTIEAFIRTTADVAVESLFLAKHSCGTDNGYFLEIYTNSSDGAHTPNGPAFYVGANTNHVYGTASVVDGAWHHVAGTWDGTTSTLYVDGAFVASKAVTYGTTNGLDLLLGAATTGACRNYTGLLDEVSIWSVVRTPVQIAADTGGPIAPNAPGLEAYFDFNGARCGQTLADRSPHGRDGLLGGSADITASDPTWVTDGPF